MNKKTLQEMKDEIAFSLVQTPENRKAISIELAHNTLAAAILHRSAELLFDACIEYEKLEIAYANSVVDGMIGVPHYTSTYCYHHLHNQCRLTCKHCHASCKCKCHVI